MIRTLQKSLSLFIVFCYQLGQIYISNIIFLIGFLNQISISRRFKFISSRKTSFLLFIFLGYITLNTVIYAVFFKQLELRSIPQFLYNFQYLYLILFIDLDFFLIKKMLVRLTTILSLIIIFVFLFSSENFEFFKWNEIMNSYFPGWPNTIPLILILSLYLVREMNYSLIFLLIIIFAALLTGSRGAILGMSGVLLLPVIRKIRRYINFILISSLITLVFYFNVLINYENDFKFLRAFDRIDIFYTSIAYIKQSLLFGYGGNTIEQLSYIKIDYEPLMDWGHTHNFVLEFTLRYGLLGILLFGSFLFLKIKEIKNFDLRYMFFLFIVLSFFQTFMRDFTFLFILIFLSHYRPQSIEK
ncbi:O-antigen ligase family protein [Aquirufa sp. KTFRIE-69F]|uniref:O-antigen ligase family protein n=1 Tax=Aquirufa originis TaxID=3096514 RepID=A0ABW6D6E8_9BACT